MKKFVELFVWRDEKGARIGIKRWPCVGEGRGATEVAAGIVWEPIEEGRTPSLPFVLRVDHVIHRESTPESDFRYQILGQSGEGVQPDLPAAFVKLPRPVWNSIGWVDEELKRHQLVKHIREMRADVVRERERADWTSEWLLRQSEDILTLQRRNRELEQRIVPLGMEGDSHGEG